MTSAAEGGGGFEMPTVADKGEGRGSKPCWRQQKLFQIKRAYHYAWDYCINILP